MVYLLNYRPGLADLEAIHEQFKAKQQSITPFMIISADFHQKRNLLLKNSRQSSTRNDILLLALTPTSPSANRLAASVEVGGLLALIRPRTHSSMSEYERSTCSQAVGKDLSLKREKSLLGC